MEEPSDDPARTAPDRWAGAIVADKFRVDALIGEGAMGRVYRAVHLALGKPVAIKFLHAHLSGDPRLAKRFHLEARAACRLSHPNSLQVIDFGEAHDGTLFIAMELLDGDDLQAVIDNDAPLSPARIGDLMGQTLRAVDEAHHAGIIHRDLKPENVIVLEERGGRERVKVCDFGIAKITDDEGKSTAITKDGYVCGTPEYMAPEQAKGEPIDLRVDLYSAGVMLYQLLAGQVPFQAESALGVITKHIMDAPLPPRRVRPEWGIPRSLERIALRALSKAKEERYASAGEMADAIAEAVRELGDRSRERLGEGSFALEAQEEREAPEEVDLAPTASGTATRRASAAKPSARPREVAGRTWALAFVGAVAVLAVGVWLWVREPTAPSGERSTPVANARSQAQDDARGGPELAPSRRREPAPAELSPEALGPAAPAEAALEPAARAPSTRRPRPPASPRAAPAPTSAAEQPPGPAASAGEEAFDEGRRRILRGDLSGAIASFESAEREMPGSARVQKELARAYMRAGNVARGISAYRRYLALAPSAPDRAIVERIIAQHGG